MKKKEILKVLIILFVVICIICVIVLKIYKNTNVADGIYTQKDLEMIDDQVDEYLADKITPKGIAKLYGNYKGDNDLNDIYRSLYKLVNYLPTISKKIDYQDNESITSYYEKNASDIKTNIGISNIEDFKKFIEYLNKVGYKGEDFIDCQIDSSTLKNGSAYFSFELTFNFENIDNIFKLKLNFANKSSTKPLIYYSIIENSN